MSGFVSTQTVEMHTAREGHDLIVHICLRCTAATFPESSDDPGAAPEFEVELIGVGPREQALYVSARTAGLILGDIYDDLVCEAEQEAIALGSF